MGESWKRTLLVRKLLTAGYQVISFDRRENGKFDKPHTAEAYAKDAEAVAYLQKEQTSTYPLRRRK